MKIVFFGSDHFVVPILDELTKHYEIPLVLTTERLPHEPITAYAKTHNLACIQVHTFSSQVIEQIKQTHTEIAVLAFFGLILPQTVLDVFPKGIINVHPSLLPKFRGPTPVQSAMLSGVKETGVSIMRLDNEVDHGPILAQETEPILPTDTDETLHARLFTKGAKLLSHSLNEYVEGILVPTEQNHVAATFTKRLRRDSGYFDSTTPPSPDELQLLIRAYYPWPGVWTTTQLKGEQKRIKFLPGGKVHVQDKKPMSYKDFLNGYPEKRTWLQKLGLM